MSVSTECPAAPELERFVLGQVGEGEAGRLEAHISHCEGCVGRLHALRADDPVTQALRAQTTVGEGPEQDVVEGLVARLSTLDPLAGDGPAVTQVPGRSDEPGDTFSLDFLAPAEVPGELGRLGPYRVLTLLGAGGMGVVFRAEDPSLERQVALKVMRPALASNPAARQRFLREARLTAALEHDHIVTIFQVGEDRGIPYLAMPLLKGESLERRLKRQGKLPLAETLRIGREIALGLAAAHARGLIHRDIKPGNIWLEARGEPGASVPGGRVKILDFGLARPAADTAHLTQSGAIVGTPAYMAPEQTRGGAAGPSADMFSLGCVLYRMATSVLPFTGPDTLALLAALANDTPAAPCELDPSLPAAFSDLVMRLLARKPEHRPQSAHVVAGWLEVLQRDQSAALPGLPKRADDTQSLDQSAGAAATPAPARPLRRPRLLLVAAVVLVAAGLGAFLFGPVLIRVVTNQGELVIETDDPDIEVLVLQGGELVKVIDRKSGHAITLTAGTYQLELGHGKERLQLSTRQLTLSRGGKEIVRILPGSAVVATVPTPKAAAPPGERFEGRTHTAVRLLKGHTKSVWAVNFSPDGRRAVSGSWDGTLRLWEVPGGKQVRSLDAGEVLAAAFLPDSRRVLSGIRSFKNSGGWILWDMDKGTNLREYLMGQTWSMSVALTADGKRALVCGLGSVFVLWDVEKGQELRRFVHQGPMVAGLALSADGRLGLSCSDHGTIIRVWNVAESRELRQLVGHKSGVRGVALSPDGRRAVSVSDDGTARAWEVATGTQLSCFTGHKGPVLCVALTPDGRVLSAGEDRVLRLWDVLTGRELHRFPGHTGAVHVVAVSPNGRWVLSGSDDTTVRLWVLPPDEPVALRRGGGQLHRFDGNTNPVWSVAFADGGKTVLSTSMDTVRRWDTATGAPRGKLWEVHKYPERAVLSADGRRVVFDYRGRDFYVWNTDAQKHHPDPRTRGNALTCTAFSADGQRLIGGNQPLDVEPPAVQVWEVESGKEVAALYGHTEVPQAVALSADGRLALSAANDGVRLWEVKAKEEQRLLLRRTVRSLAFSPDGRHAVLGEAGGDIVLWDLATGRGVRTFKGHTGVVNSLAFSPGGRRALSGGNDKTVRLWDVETGQELRCFVGHDNSVLSVAFAPDGRQILSGSSDRSVRLWGIGER
jgi:WD40 repeat protein/serine/threonine protein kinase